MSGERVPVQRLNTCVCGCPRADHQTVPLSVLLPARPDGPIYKTGTPTKDGIIGRRFTEQCSCGCMAYLEDH